ncbi:MAG TPA: RNA polymerase sigma factor [Candidatus Dormibacteraeota bacterium]|nr:RNA polymerase sigma factor [Candidatus Dormibacteraeota bacterium]
MDFERLYREYRGKLLQTLTAVLRDPAEAEDCVQETFERAYTAWPSFRPEAPAAAWLHRIAINVAISHRRRQSLRQVGETVRRLGRPSPVPDAASSTDALDLVDGLRRLPARQAVVIVLRHLHGYSNREIATALGVPERTVASRLAAAKRRLVAELDGFNTELVEESGPTPPPDQLLHPQPMRGAPDG